MAVRILHCDIDSCARNANRRIDSRCVRARSEFLFAIALFIVGAFVTGCSRQPAEAQKPAPQVSVRTIAPATVPYIVNFVAQTESSRQVDIVARVSGFLERIAYREGEMVREGQVLFELDKKPFQAQIDEAKGALLAQQARFSTARANLDRVKPLAAQDALSRADLDRAQGEYDAARAAVFAAQARLRDAEIDLSYTTLRAPVTGLASRSLQREGVFLNAQSDSSKLTYVAAVDPIWVNFSVSQNQMASLRDQILKGLIKEPKDKLMAVEIVLPDGSVYPEKGKIDFRDPNFSQDTGSFLVRAVVANPKQQLSPGMFVTAKVMGFIRPDAVVVPQLAVQQGSNGHLVYVIKADNTAELRPVIVGEYYGDKDIVIVDGLKAGDKVVVDGALKVVPGKAVQIVTANDAAAQLPVEQTPAGQTSAKQAPAKQASSQQAPAAQPSPQ